MSARRRTLVAAEDVESIAGLRRLCERPDVRVVIHRDGQASTAGEDPSTYTVERVRQRGVDLRDGDRTRVIHFDERSRWTFEANRAVKTLGSARGGAELVIEVLVAGSAATPKARVARKRRKKPVSMTPALKKAQARYRSGRASYPGSLIPQDVLQALESVEAREASVKNRTQAIEWCVRKAAGKI